MTTINILSTLTCATGLVTEGSCPEFRAMARVWLYSADPEPTDGIIISTVQHLLEILNPITIDTSRMWHLEESYTLYH